MSIGNDQAPYRPPCGNVYRSARYVVGSCYQHKRATERGIPVMDNVTEKVGGGTVTNGTACDQLPTECEGGTFKDGNCFMPAEAPTGTVKTDGSAYAEEVLQVTLAASGSGHIEIGYTVMFDGDTTVYTATSAVADVSAGGVLGISPPLVKAIEESEEGTFVTVTAVHDFSLCHKVGWKAVRARKAWHGLYGFTVTPVAYNCPNNGGVVCSDVGTRYLTVLRTVNGTLTQKKSPSGTYTYTLSQSQQTSVASSTGRITLDSHAYAWEAQDGGAATDPTQAQLLGVGSNGLIHCGVFNIESLDQGVAPIGEDGWPTGDYSADFEPWGLAGWWMTSLTFNDTYISFTLHSNAPQSSPPYKETAWWGDVTVVIQLTNPYYYTDAYQTACDLLDEWNLGDDVRHPWRTDLSCGAVPLVAVRENAPTHPDIGNVCVWPEEEDCSYTDTLLASCDGSTIGAPLPRWKVVNTTGQEQAFYQCEFPHPASPTLPQWAPSYLVPAVTFWQSGAALPDGAFHCYYDGYAYVQKWAIIKDSQPSINFFRPCGADRDTVSPDFSDAWAICGRCAILSQDDNTPVGVVLSEEAPYLRKDPVGGVPPTPDVVDFVHYDADFTEHVDASAVAVASRTDSTHFTFDHAKVTGATHIKSSGAPHYKWNNDTAKGDYTFLQWTRTVASDCTTEDTCSSCTQGCILRTPCAPSVICITPNVEADTFDNAAIHAFAAASANTFWRAIAIPDIDDPFGSAFRVESRCAVPTNPTGCPALHANVYLPCPNPTLAGCPDGYCSPPTEDGVCYETGVWV